MNNGSEESNFRGRGFPTCRHWGTTDSHTKTRPIVIMGTHTREPIIIANDEAVTAVLMRRNRYLFRSAKSFQAVYVIKNTCITKSFFECDETRTTIEDQQELVQGRLIRYFPIASDDRFAGLHNSLGRIGIDLSLYTNAMHEQSLLQSNSTPKATRPPSQSYSAFLVQRHTLHSFRWSAFVLADYLCSSTRVPPRPVWALHSILFRMSRPLTLLPARKVIARICLPIRILEYCFFLRYAALGHAQILLLLTQIVLLVQTVGGYVGTANISIVAIFLTFKRPAWALALVFTCHKQHMCIKFRYVAAASPSVNTLPAISP